VSGQSSTIDKLQSYKPCTGLMVDSSQLTFLASSKSRDTKT